MQHGNLRSVQVRGGAAGRDVTSSPVSSMGVEPLSHFFFNSYNLYICRLLEMSSTCPCSSGYA